MKALMTDRAILLESALDKLPDGLAVFDAGGSVVFWNAAAEAITGYAFAEIPGGVLPRGLNQLFQERSRTRGPQRLTESRLNCGVQVRARHKAGHEIPVVVHDLRLYDGLGDAIGAAILFHPAERLDTLPHDDEKAVSTCRVKFEERLFAEYEVFASGGEPFGIVWIGIDQLDKLRKTHGAAACHMMLDRVESALASGLRPAEELGRWGENEFLIIAHERTSEKLARHAGMLSALARTADFRWWGDRISLTVSVGAVQANRRQTLPALLKLAREAMESSMRTGGDRVTCAPVAADHDDSTGEELACTPS